MKLRDVAIASLISLPIVAYFIGRASATNIPSDASMYIHVKHQLPYPITLGKVQQMYSAIALANKTGRNIGVEPQVIGDWETKKAYYRECGKIPVMCNVLTSDESLVLPISQLQEIIGLCNVKWLRIHEALSYFNPFPTQYLQQLLAFSKDNNLPIFWNEWNVNMFPMLANLIQGYEDNVAVSFGTNNNWLEPSQGYQLLQQFKRKGASVQSWYWWERHDRQNGYELLMPPALITQFTQQAFQANCEIVQYEPMEYFFNEALPKSTLTDVLGQKM